MNYTWYWVKPKLNEDGSIIGIRCAIPDSSTRELSNSWWSVCGYKINVIESMQHVSDVASHCDKCQIRIDKVTSLKEKKRKGGAGIKASLESHTYGNSQ